MGSPPPAWWVKLFVGALLKVDYNGPDFMEASKVEVHSDYVDDDASIDVSGQLDTLNTVLHDYYMYIYEGKKSICPILKYFSINIHSRDNFFCF